MPVRPIIRAGFNHLSTKDHHVKGYVIMPNHLHVIIDFGTAKKYKYNYQQWQKIHACLPVGRAYKIVERLKEQNKTEILLQLSDAVINSDRDKGKTHQVFERSFDCKEITSHHFFLQKLSYLHNNPCSGTLDLVKNPVDYKHSSAKLYISGEQGLYLIKEG